MSQSRPARDPGAKGKGRAEAPPSAFQLAKDSSNEKVSHSKYLRFLVETPRISAARDPSTPSQHRQTPTADLAAKVVDLQTQVHHVRRTQRSGLGTVPAEDMRTAKDALKAAMQGVQSVEDEAAARVKGNAAKISRMEKKLLASKTARKDSSRRVG
ncbi:hypothetical protein DAEQUDRAFT_768170 [Daedalea quercina L-15889]|uniref:Uncharacterized protein n=1 Tax=Daedalea quercina L-15889 TaxID=1314783 RepID=A0A165MXL4_9APHY|nr:hypothetical protein DAEQUDRAFT_768170 [Daedalea quercina L-15889]